MSGARPGETSRAAANGACSKVQAWLRSTHMQGQASVQDASQDKCERGSADLGRRGAHSTSSEAWLRSPVWATSCQQDQTDSHREGFDPVQAKFASLPDLLLRAHDITQTESFTDDDSGSLEGTARCPDEPPSAVGSSMLNMLSSVHRSSASVGAAAQPLQRLRCPQMTSPVPCTTPAANAAPGPSQLPLTSGGPLGASDAVQQRIARLFPEPGTSATTSGTVPAPSSTARQRLKQSLQSRRTSVTSSVTLVTELANELDISSTTESTTMALATPRSVLAGTADAPLCEPFPFHPAPKPSWDESRVAALQSLHMLGTPPEARFDRITNLVAQLLGFSMGVINLIDTDEQKFKSALGFGGLTETCRENSICAWNLLSAAPECLVIPDTQADVRTACNPFVAAPPGLRAYVSAPLVSTVGARLGTLCLLDTVARHLTAQDCALLCNCADVAVRELEARRADELLAFGGADDAAPAEMRSSAAWDVGILILTIREGEWKIVHANERSFAVLGVRDADADLIGRDFWAVFSARGGGGGCASAAAAAAQHRGFEANVSVYTATGRKHWLSASFRAGASEQLDGQCATVGFPIELPSEPGLHQDVWFVTLQPMVDAGEALPDNLRQAAADGAEPLLAYLPAHAALSQEQLQGIQAGGHVSCTVHGELFRATLPPDAPASSPAAAQAPALAELRVTPQPAVAAAALEAAQQRWRAAGLAEFALLDTVRTEVGEGAVLVLRRAPGDGAVSVRTAIHDGMLRVPCTDPEVYIAVDVPLVLDAFMHAVRGLCRLHAAGIAHGDISDTTLILSHAPHATGTPASRPTIRFATLGRPEGPAPTLEQSADVRCDLPLFVAPEMAAAGPEVPATPEADVWAMGTVLAYCLRPSLPYVTEGPLGLQAKAAAGTLASEVIRLTPDTLPAGLPALLDSCLQPDPARRPTAAHLLQHLSHISKALPALPGGL